MRYERERRERRFGKGGKYLFVLYEVMVPFMSLLALAYPSCSGPSLLWRMNPLIARLAEVPTS
jgi:hypothetical protein